MGTRDNLVGSAHPLAEAISGSRLVEIEGRDHLNTPGSKAYKEAVIEFFRETSA